MGVKSSWAFAAGYAQPLLDVLDPQQQVFAARLYRQALVQSRPCHASLPQHGMFVYPCHVQFAHGFAKVMRIGELYSVGRCLGFRVCFRV
jgi:hypothetical protein